MTSCVYWRRGDVFQSNSFSSRTSPRFLDAHGKVSLKAARLASAVRDTRSTNQTHLFLGLIRRSTMISKRSVASVSVATTLAGFAAKFLRFLK
jgi:hypothetical protein